MSLMPLISLAQLTAPGMKAVRYTSYPSALTVKDPVFIYCNATGTQKGALSASSPGGTGPFTFLWFKWSDAAKSFSIPLPSGPGDTPSSRNNLDEGGYRVRIANGSGYQDSLTAWIFFDTPPIAEAGLQQQTCDRVALKGKAAASIHNFYYRDPFNGKPVILKNDTTFLWSSNPSSFIPGPDINLYPVIENYSPGPSITVYRLPLENLIYKLQVNSIGCSSEASFPYTSIHVKADFSVKPDKGEAPLTVRFDPSKSVRGFYYRWEFGDDTINTLQNKDTVTHIYYRPGEYSVKLTIESDLTCIDSMRFNKIVVDPSELKIPNVFTPNNDGFNDYFIVESKSLRTINVEIFSRSGIMVYRFIGDRDRLKEWKGWDGNVNNSSVKATPGVYFYIIRAKGWDDKVYDSREYRGFLYLYR